MSKFDRFHVDPAPDFTGFITTVIDRVPMCPQHPQGYEGAPCHFTRGDRVDQFFYSVCDIRARKAGFVGEPSSTVHQKSYPAPAAPRNSHFK